MIDDKIDEHSSTASDYSTLHLRPVTAAHSQKRPTSFETHDFTDFILRLRGVCRESMAMAGHMGRHSEGFSRLCILDEPKQAYQLHHVRTTSVSACLPT